MSVLNYERFEPGLSIVVDEKKPRIPGPAMRGGQTQ
jgi:hypothetical protein